MTEFVLLTVMVTIAAAWLFYPDNGIYDGIRKTFSKTKLILALPGP